MKSVHEGVREFVCNQCGNHFSEAKNLKNHIKTVHEGIKDYKCETCGKEFAYLNSLKLHIKSCELKQLKPKPICQNCGKDCTYASKLARHQESCFKGKCLKVPRTTKNLTKIKHWTCSSHDYQRKCFSISYYEKCKKTQMWYMK